eukprot:scaffold545_cov372-Pavlova_lutheri.AAC.15
MGNSGLGTLRESGLNLVPAHPSSHQPRLLSLPSRLHVAMLLSWTHLSSVLPRGSPPPTPSCRMPTPFYACKSWTHPSVPANAMVWSFLVVRVGLWIRGLVLWWVFAREEEGKNLGRSWMVARENKEQERQVWTERRRKATRTGMGLEEWNKQAPWWSIAQTTG